MSHERLKTALVTGAASGIGAAITTTLIARGYRVIAVDRDARGLAALDGEHVAAIEADVADEAALHDAVAGAGLDDGLDAAVACAGVSFTGDLAATTVEAWDHVHRVNLRGVFLLAREVAPLLARSGSGAFVAIASELGLIGVPGLTAYCSAKAGVINLMRVLALEQAERGVRYNAVAPGGTRTPMLDREQERTGRSIEDIARTNPLRRVARPEEIANVVAFALSPEASYVNGSVLVADGGFTSGIQIASS